MRYEVEVTDPMGRKRNVTVETIPGRVSVVVPAGEGFSMNWRQAGLLAEALRVASATARADA